MRGGAMRDFRTPNPPLIPRSSTGGQWPEAPYTVVVPHLDVSMSRDEAIEYLESSRVGVFATIGPLVSPPLAAMHYVVVPGQIEFVTYRKAQKAINIRRDRRAAFLVESGDTYETLRGV